MLKYLKDNIVGNGVSKAELKLCTDNQEKIEDFSFPEHDKIHNDIKKSYSMLSGEYYDKNHKTCRFFDRINRKILKRYDINSILLDKQKKVLELGCGLSVILESCKDLKAFSVFSDISTDMLRHSIDLDNSCDANFMVLSAFELPFRNNSFDVIIAFLADSFNYPTYYHEVHRVLKPNGQLLETLPSDKWAKLWRQENNERYLAKFTLKTGENIKVPSITYSDNQYLELLKTIGFRKISYMDFCLNEDTDKDLVPSSIFNVAYKLNTHFSKVPVITTVNALK